MPATRTPASIVRALVDAVSEPVAFFSADQTLVAMNASFARIARDLFGAPLREQDRIPDLRQPDREGRRCRFWASILSRGLAGAPLASDLLVEGEEGPRCYSISVVPVRAGHGIGLMSVSAHPLEPAQEGAHREAMELTLGRLFSDEHTLAESLHSTLEFLCQSDGWDYGIAWLARGDALDAVAVWHDGRKVSRDFDKAVREMRFSAGQGLPGRAFVESRVIWLPDLLEETGGLRWPYAVPLGFRGVVGVPLRAGGTSIGVFEFFTRAIRPVNETTVRSLAETGAAIGRLVEHRRAADERRRLQEELAMRGSEWAQTFDAIELPIFITTAEGTIIRTNRAARELGGRVSLERRSIGRIERSELWRTLGDMVRAVVETSSACTAQAIDALGTRHWDLTASLFTPADRDEQRVILILRDVTTTVTLQESVRRGEQLAAMGELVAGVAHEVRNPLFGMTATLDAYESAVGSTPDGAEMIVALRSWIRRVNVLMEDLLEYGKTWHVDLQPGDLQDAVGQAIVACEPQARAAGVTIRADAPTHSMTMLMDPARLCRALQNVVMNAIQHSPQGGRVEIATRRQGGAEGVTLQVDVRDSGPGFAPADVGRIFQPFFTRRRGGTGLGLPIVLRITDEHGGTVRATNGEHGGGLVQLQFPEFGSGEAETPR